MTPRIVYLCILITFSMSVLALDETAENKSPAMKLLIDAAIKYAEEHQVRVDRGTPPEVLPFVGDWNRVIVPYIGHAILYE